MQEATLQARGKLGPSSSPTRRGIDYLALRSSLGRNASVRSATRGKGVSASVGAGLGDISLSPATGNGVHDVIFRAYKPPTPGGNVDANREDAVRVVRWMAHMDARIFKPLPQSPSLSNGPRSPGAGGAAVKRNQGVDIDRNISEASRAASSPGAAQTHPGEGCVRSAHLVNAVAFAELARQSTVHCAERGAALAEVWRRQEALVAATLTALHHKRGGNRNVGGTAGSRERGSGRGEGDTQGIPYGQIVSNGGNPDAEGIAISVLSADDRSPGPGLLSGSPLRSRGGETITPDVSPSSNRGQPRAAATVGGAI